MKRTLALFLLFADLFCCASQPQLCLQRGHSEQITGLQVSPDGDFVVTSSNDKLIKIWDVKTGRELRTIQGHTQAVKSLALSMDGRRIASGGNRKEKSIMVWDESSGEKLFELAGLGGEISALAFNSTGQKLAIVEQGTNFETRVSVWDCISRTELFEVYSGNTYTVNTVAWSPSKDEFAVGGASTKKMTEKNVTIYNGTTGKSIKALKGTPTSVSYLQYSVRGQKLLVVGHATQVWDANTWTIEKQIGNAGTTASYSSDGRYACIGQNNMVHMIDLLTEKETISVKAHDKAVVAVGFTSDARYVFSASKSGELKFWERESLTQMPHFGGNNADPIRSILPLGDVVYASTESNALQVWDMTSGKHSTISVEVETNKEGAVQSLCRGATDNQILFAGTADRGVHLTEAKTGKSIRFYSHTAYCKSATLSTDQSLIAAGTMDNKVIVWGKSDSKAEVVLTGHTGNVNTVVFTPDSKFILSGSQDKTVRLWDLSQKKQIWSFPVGQYVNSLSISPDGEIFIVACGDEQNALASEPGKLLVFSLNELQSYGTSKKDKQPIVLRGHTKAVTALRFSSKGSILATGSVDNTIILWDTNKWVQIKNLHGHSSQVTSLAFINNDATLVSGGTDGLLKLWNVVSGSNETTMVSFGAGEEFILFTPDNYYTCSTNGTDNIHFVDGDKVFLFEQFDLRLNRPDLVLQTLPYANKNLENAYKKAYQKRLKKMGFTESMFDGAYHIPDISIDNADALGYVAKSKNIQIQLSAFDRDCFLDRIHVWVNDVPIFGSAGVSLRDEKVNEIHKSIEVQLSAGKNKIQVAVLNQKGAESFKADKMLYLDVPVAKPDLYVATIGVSAFSDAQFNLDYAAKDAQDIQDMFKKSAGKYGHIYSKHIVNTEATTGNIQAIKTFFANSKVDDHIVLFIASHGILDDNLDYYLATTDIDFQAPSGKGLLYSDLEALLDGVPARNKLLLIDACHSGEVDKDEIAFVAQPSSESLSGQIKARGFKRIGSTVGMASSFELMKEMFADLSRGSGAVVISSAGGKEFALESSQWNNGVFTYALLEGLQTMHADLDGNGTVSVSELKKYISAQVQALTDGRQNPTSRKDNLSNDFIVW